MDQALRDTCCCKPWTNMYSNYSVLLRHFRLTSISGQIMFAIRFLLQQFWNLILQITSPVSGKHVYLGFAFREKKKVGVAWGSNNVPLWHPFPCGTSVTTMPPFGWYSYICLPPPWIFRTAIDKGASWSPWYETVFPWTTADKGALGSPW